MANQMFNSVQLFLLSCTPSSHMEDKVKWALFLNKKTPKQINKGRVMENEDRLIKKDEEPAQWQDEWCILNPAFQS